jgi:hypothetical protein
VFSETTFFTINGSASIGAEGGIRTHEPLRDRLLKPTPLTWLGDLCANRGALPNYTWEGLKVNGLGS